MPQPNPTQNPQANQAPRILNPSRRLSGPVVNAQFRDMNAMGGFFKRHLTTVKIRNFTRKSVKYGAEVTGASAGVLTVADFVYQTQQPNLGVKDAALKALGDLYGAIGSVGQFVFEHPIVTAALLIGVTALSRLGRSFTLAPHRLAQKVAKWSAGLLALRAVSEFVYLSSKTGASVMEAGKGALMDARDTVAGVARYAFENPVVTVLAVAAYVGVKKAHEAWQRKQAEAMQRAAQKTA